MRDLAGDRFPDVAQLLMQRDYVPRRDLEEAVSERNAFRSALERVESHGSGYAVTIAREALASTATPSQPSDER